MAVPNLQHSDKWSLILSNFPGFHPAISTLDNTQLFELYVKEVSFPNLSLELAESRFRNYKIHHQISQKNDNMGSLEISFKVSEALKNYLLARRFIENSREGINVDKEKWFRLNCIKEIIINFLDNEKRPKTKMKFTNGFITDVSSLTLTQGQDTEMTFTLSITYEDYIMEDVEVC